MYAPDDPFAVRRPAPLIGDSETDPAGDDGATETVADEPNVDALDGVEVAVGAAAGEQATEVPAPTAAQAASDTDLLDRAEATFAGASEVIDLVESGELDQAESLLESLVTPSSP